MRCVLPNRMRVTLRRIQAGVLLAGLLWLPLGCGAAVVERLDVQRHGEDYLVHLEVLLRAPLPQVWRVLTDYARLSRLSPAIQESEVLQRIDARTHRVRTLIHSCVLIFCKSIHQVQVFRQRGQGELEAAVEPEQSDLAFGQAHWRLREERRLTKATFEARVRPAFWVPPVIGPWAIQLALEQEAKVTSEGLERQAAESGP